MNDVSLRTAASADIAAITRIYAHFRAYPRNPEHAHARYLIQALPEGHVATWPEVAGAVRVAQGVRKEFLVASVDGSESVRFLSLERIRP
jgi:tRNA splicing endonuclease